MIRTEIPKAVEKELERFRIEPAVVTLRALLIDPQDEVRVCPYTLSLVNVTMIAKINDRVFIGFRHTTDEAKWGIFFLDDEDPMTLGRENYWYMSLEDAFNNCPGWQGELPEDYVIE